MARGGIYDQVGGGFARYSVDAQWLVPHFEKMLYDNALLVRLGAHLWQATRDAEVRRVTEETIDWVAREMTSPEGGFYSSLDADSEGHEGNFYVWDASELDVPARRRCVAGEGVLGRDARGELRGAQHSVRAARSRGRGAGAGRHGRQSCAPRWSARRASCTTRASERVRPGARREDPRRWNGLMLRGARRSGARVRRRGAARARRAQRRVPVLARSCATAACCAHYKDGAARIPGFLEDYAAVALGALALYQLTFDRVVARPRAQRWRSPS